VAALVAGWEAACRAGLLDPLFVPAPSAVAQAMAGLAGEAFQRLGDTLLKTVIGYVIAVTLGVAAGVFLGSVRAMREVVMPYVVVITGIPKILILPWVALIFGIGMATAVWNATLLAFFPIVVMVGGGVRDVDPVLLTVATSMGASRWQIYRKVILPAVLPSVMAAMRIGMVFALLGVLLAEMFAGIRGMGFLMQRLANAFKAPEVFAATVLVSVFSIVVVLSLEHLNRRLGTWR
jgi:NitT/TauT family transport system permease protein